MKKIEFYWALALAAALRISQLGTASYWYDEGFTVSISRLPLLNMLEATAGDVHPPGYYLVTWLTARISDSEWIMRAPSVIFSLLSLYITWRLVKLFKLSRLGQIVVVLWVTISPLQLHYAQEVRMYSLLQLEVLWLIYLMITRRWFWFGLVAAAALYTHNYSLFYLPTLGMLALLRDRDNGWKDFPDWGLAFVLPGLLWLPWFLVLMGQMNTVGGGYWIQPPTPASVFFVIYQLLFAYSMPQILQGIAVVLMSSLLLYTSWRIWKDRPAGWFSLTVLTVGPMILSLIASVLWRPIFFFRGFIGCSVPMVMLVVSALDGIKANYKKAYIFSMIGVLLVGGVAGFYLYNVPNKGTADKWVGMIEKNWQEGDVILALNDNGVVALNTYGEDLPYYKVPSCGQESLGSLSPKTRAALGVVEKPPEALEQRRVWFISTVAPVSSKCEVERSREIIRKYDAVLVNELADNEYLEAGVYLLDG